MRRLLFVVRRPGMCYTVCNRMHERMRRTPYENTRNRIDTAEQFIDKVASSSSITGKPYIVKIPGKSDENAQPFLHALIAQTDKTVPAEGN